MEVGVQIILCVLSQLVRSGKTELGQELAFLYAPYFVATFVHTVKGIGEANSALQHVVYCNKCVSHLLARQHLLLQENWFVVVVPLQFLFPLPGSFLLCLTIL